MNIYAVASQAVILAKQKKPQILTGMGIAGNLLAIGAAIRGTSRYKDEINEIKNVRPVTKKDVIKALRHYIPMVTFSVAGNVASIGGVATALSRVETISTAAMLSATKLDDVKESIREVVGDKKADEIETKVAEKQLQRAPLDNARIFTTGRGNQLFYDPNWAVLFRSDMDTVKRAVNRVNEMRLCGSGDEVDVGDFYNELYIDDIPDASSGFGWSPETEPLTIDPKARYIDVFQESAIVIEYTPYLLHPEYYARPSRW